MSDSFDDTEGALQEAREANATHRNDIRGRGADRELALVATKLDEARLWLAEARRLYGIANDLGGDW